MNTTTHYELSAYEGTDKVNPLTVDAANMEAIDEALYDVACSAFDLATESKSGTTHQIVRTNSDCAVMRFVATSDFVANDSFTVDGIAVSGLDTAGNTLTDGAFKSGNSVIAILVQNILTVICNGGAVANAANSQKLDNHTADYFATQSDMDAVELVADGAANIATANQTALNGLKLWSGTHAAYDAIVSKDSNTLYFIVAN